MPADEAPEDDDVRQTYNFAPGSYGLVYRADVPDYGAGPAPGQSQDASHDEGASNKDNKDANGTDGKDAMARYKLQAMKWGLVPFWTKRKPDYGSMMKTINCRDDSLATPGGMWTTMKQRKRCIIVCQGFYEWLKKNGGKEKIPHFVKRKDGELMCFAGLWDCAKFEDAEEKLYTYSIITTDSNQQLGFLHDRMPVIFDNGSSEMFTWLDSNRLDWNKELQSLLKPYKGDLECYPVVKEVGKVGNNSPSFIVPLDSAENKQNIVNFFGNQRKAASTKEAKDDAGAERSEAETVGTAVEHEAGEDRDTVNVEDTESNAPRPVAGRKRGHDDGEARATDHISAPGRSQKASDDSGQLKSPSTPMSSKRSKNAVKNHPLPHMRKSPGKSAAEGSQKITNFFGGG